MTHFGLVEFGSQILIRNLLRYDAPPGNVVVVVGGKDYRLVLSKAEEVWHIDQCLRLAWYGGGYERDLTRAALEAAGFTTIPEAHLLQWEWLTLEGYLECLGKSGKMGKRVTPAA